MPSPFRRLLLPIAYMGAVYLLSSIPGEAPADEEVVKQVFQWLSPEWQNLLHVPLYGGLAACWLWALAKQKLSHTSWLALAMLFTVIWAVLDETHQMTVPGRYASLTDLALNIIGALLATVYAGLNRKTFRPTA